MKQTIKRLLNWKSAILILVILQLLIFGLIKINEGREWHLGGEQGAWQAPILQKVPPCPDPLFSHSIVDTTLMKNFLYPGQYRGTDYKPHGGIGLSDSQASIRLPMDAKLISAARYIQAGDLQYFLEFRNDCGIQFRYDHLLTLTPVFQEFIDKLPPAKPDDSRTTSVNSQVFPAGTEIATAVGLPAMNNTGFDFGVMDLRQPNEISKNPQWAAIQDHQDNWEQDAYGICWFDILPPVDASRFRAREAILGKEPDVEDLTDPAKAVSDYCDGAPGGKTLDHNGGLPAGGEA